jgi:hypothetical protein
MARSVDVELTLDDFQTISNKTPFLADLKPSGKYVMEDVQRIGGTPAVLRFGAIVLIFLVFQLQFIDTCWIRK